MKLPKLHIAIIMSAMVAVALVLLKKKDGKQMSKKNKDKKNIMPEIESASNNVKSEETPLQFATCLDVNVRSWMFMGTSSNSIGSNKPDAIDFNIEVLGRSNDNYEAILKLIQSETKSSVGFYNSQAPIIITLQRSYIYAPDSNRMAEKLAKFINHHLAVREHIYLDFSVPRYRLDGRPIFYRERGTESWIPLIYNYKILELEKIFEEYSLLGETGHGDIVDWLTSEPFSIDVSWRILVEAIRHFYEGSYRECVINCCSAVEVEISPRVQKWLTDNMLTKSEEVARNANLEIGNPMRFELYFKSVNPESLEIYQETERLRLLENLKGLNTRRNRVVHRGEDADRHDAVSSIMAAGALLRATWLHEHMKKFPPDLAAALHPDHKAN